MRGVDEPAIRADELAGGTPVRAMAEDSRVPLIVLKLTPEEDTAEDSESKINGSESKTGVAGDT